MIKYNIAHIVARLFFDKPARKYTLAQLATRMQESGKRLENLLNTTADNYAHYDCLAHIIGIERWGQKRLRVVFGEPLVMEEYDSYRPSIALFWDDLRHEFTTTRQQSIALVHELEQAGIDQTVAVRHNELGIMTVHGWILYLDMHANLEAKKFHNSHR